MPKLNNCWTNTCQVIHRQEKAILSWTELKLVQGQTDMAIERLAPLTIAFPTDPYYLLAAVEVVLQEAYVTPTAVTDLLDGVAACAGDSSDVLAKIGFAAAMRTLVLWDAFLYQGDESRRKTQHYGR